MALAGGSTPRLLHARLVSGREGQSVPWERTRFFWGDERCVPPDSERSNYRMARQTLLAPLGIAAAQVFRMRGELEPRRAASAYEAVLESELGAARARFDLVLLGLGADGHTASLFPGSSSLAERRHWVMPATAPATSAGPGRMTFTLPLINAARAVMFVVAGADKAAAVRSIRTGSRELPAARVRATSTLWLLDLLAAGEAAPK